MNIAEQKEKQLPKLMVDGMVILRIYLKQSIGHSISLRVVV